MALCARRGAGRLQRSKSRPRDGSGIPVSGVVLQPIEASPARPAGAGCRLSERCFICGGGRT
ncbi:MAG: hypothetical protein D6725_00090 [Planctomycetota bacterium]|nr:MAG: hypothetical protein D6725_00090 [Planctomycetota bacterium]